MTEQILVPMDRSEQAERALEYAIEHYPDAEITVVHSYGIEDTSAAPGAVIVMDEEIREAGKEHAKRIFEHAREVAADAGYEGDLETVAAEGDPAGVIPEEAEDFDAVIIGKHGQGSGRNILLGGVAEKVVRRSPVSVVVVK